jgi:hypothetical protein
MAWVELAAALKPVELGAASVRPQAVVAWLVRQVEWLRAGG